MTKAVDWARTYPELSTRPELVAEMGCYPKFRRELFRIFNAMHTIATIEDPKVAKHVMHVYYEYAKRRIKTYRSLEQRNPRAFNQAAAVLKNLLVNLLLPRSPKGQITPSTKPWAVVRGERSA